MEAVFGGAFKRARAELGVESFGMQVMDLPPNLDRFPEHDHASDGQEEVYLLLRGAADIDVEGDRFPLDADLLVRVPPGVKRKLSETRTAGRTPRSASIRARNARADASGSPGSSTTSSSRAVFDASTPAFAQTNP